jgi:hypothetical protein
MEFSHGRLRSPWQGPPALRRNGEALGRVVRGRRCRNGPVPGRTRCRLHGGLSTGLKTPEGRHLASPGTQVSSASLPGRWRMRFRIFAISRSRPLVLNAFRRPASWRAASPRRCGPCPSSAHAGAPTHRRVAIRRPWEYKRNRHRMRSPLGGAVQLDPSSSEALEPATPAPHLPEILDCCADYSPPREADPSN